MAFVAVLIVFGVAVGTARYIGNDQNDEHETKDDLLRLANCFCISVPSFSLLNSLFVSTFTAAPMPDNHVPFEGGVVFAVGGGAAGTVGVGSFRAALGSRLVASAVLSGAPTGNNQEAPKATCKQQSKQP